MPTVTTDYRCQEISCQHRLTAMESRANNPSEETSKPAERILRRLLWGVLIVVIVSIVGAYIWSLLHQTVVDGSVAQQQPSANKLTAHDSVPHFALTNQRGTKISPADLQGKIWVADFIFTRCAAACPLMMDKMVKLQEEFAEANVNFVSVSVDPEHDTPEVLFRYADRFGVNHDKWHLLTGEKDTIYQLSHNGFNLAVGEQKSEILHSSRFVLVDHQGKIRDYYDSNESDALQQLRQDIKTLLRSELKE